MRRRLGALALVLVVVLAGCSGTAPQTTTHGPTATTTPTTTTQPTPTTTTAVHPADPPTDVLGWEHGYWYNETLSVDQSDGLNDSELHAVVYRAMARDEYIRGLEFNESVPVEVISRQEHRNRTRDRFTGVSENDTLHQNTKFEATFFMGENESAIAQEERSQGTNVLGYYSPSEDSIVIVSDNESAPQMDEITLSQELFHALQQHKFDIANFSANTEELHNARDGIIEGDANYVEDLYRQHCDAGWQCVTPQDSGGSGGDGGSTNVGLLALRLQPYSDGPVFVKYIRDREGWAGVNAIYQSPPNSTEQTIHPAKYGVDQPTPVTIDDTSDANWSVPDLGNGSIDYAQFGEAGMYVMLWYPSYVETQKNREATDVIVPYQHFFAPGSEPGLDRYNYSYHYTNGWDGDKLVPYVRNDSAETNQTGYVWRSTWDTEADAMEFRAGYQRLLDYHGAEPVAGHPNTYRIPDGDFADAFYVRQSGDQVTIVNAPTVDELSGVHQGAGVQG